MAWPWQARMVVRAPCPNSEEFSGCSKSGQCADLQCTAAAPTSPTAYGPLARTLCGLRLVVRPHPASVTRRRHSTATTQLLDFMSFENYARGTCSLHIQSIQTCILRPECSQNATRMQPECCQNAARMHSENMPTACQRHAPECHQTAARM